MGGKHTTILRVENVSPERVVVQVDWGGGVVDSKQLDPMSQAEMTGQPKVDKLLASVEYPVRKGRLEFILNQGDLRNQAVNVRLAMVNGAGVATVNGQQRGKYSRAFHGHGLNPEPTVERHQKRAPSPLKPKPVVVHINPRILNASAPAVLPQLPKSLDSNAVSSVYDFDFGPEVELLKEEGFAVRAASGDSARVPSPIPADSWATATQFKGVGRKATP